MSEKIFFWTNIQQNHKFNRLYSSATHLRDVQFLIDWSNCGRDLMLSTSKSNDQIIVTKKKIVLTELIFKALAKCSRPSLFMLLFWQSSVINVYFHRRTNEKQNNLETRSLLRNCTGEHLQDVLLLLDLYNSIEDAKLLMSIE